MIYIIVLISICVALLGYILLLSKEIKSIAEQLREILDGKTGQKVTVVLFSNRLNQLVISVNELIETNTQTNIQTQNAQLELRQAIANMSHDLRTPLTSILGYIQLLDGKELSQEETSDYIRILHNRALRLHALINDFFELSIIDSSEHNLESTPLNLTLIVKETLLSHYEELSKNGLEPVVYGVDEPCTVLGDETAVRRVLENLIGNALKYSAGNIAVNLIEHDNIVELCVSNDVSSLSPEDVFRLFDRFYIADKTRSGQSNGLGLPIVKCLMEKMGGTVVAQVKEEELFITCRWKKA